MNRYVRTLGAAAFIAAFNLSGVACSSTTTEPTTGTVEPSPKTSADSVQTTMRQTWGDEAALTRVYLIEFIAGLPGSSYGHDRLIQTQGQFGDLMASFYRPNISGEISGLLRERTQILLDFATATRANDDAGVAATTAMIQANGKALAALLGNGVGSPVDLERLLGGLIQAQGTLQLKEIAARIGGDYRAATSAHETYLVHVSLMSDTLSGVIINTRPDLIAPSNLTAKQLQVYATMHDVWLAHETLTREWLVSAVGGLPGTPEALNELLHNQRAMGATLTTYYGSELGNTATALLGTHVILVDGYVAAAKGHDDAMMATIKAQLHTNADAIAVLLEGANPYWTGTMQAAWRDDVDHTLNQITARVAQDWKLDLASYDLNAHDGSTMAEVMATGIVRQGVQGF